MEENGLLTSSKNNELESSRILLRNFLPDDLDQVFFWGQNKIYNQTAGYPILRDKNQAQQALQQFMNRPETYAIVLKETMKPIGMIEFNDRGTTSESGLLDTKELGLFLDENYWRQGLMTETLTMFLNYGFKTLKLREIWAGVYPKNLASHRLLAHFGFEYKYTADYSNIIPENPFQEEYFLLRNKN